MELHTAPALSRSKMKKTSKMKITSKMMTTSKMKITSKMNTILSTGPELAQP